MCFLLPPAARVQIRLALEPKVGALAALPGLSITRRPRDPPPRPRRRSGPVRGEVAAAGAERGGRGGGGTLLPVRCCGGGGLVDASTSTSLPPWDPSERTGRGRATMRVRDEDTRRRGGFGGVLLLLLLHFCPVSFFLYMAWAHLTDR